MSTMTQTAGDVAADPPPPVLRREDIIRITLAFLRHYGYTDAMCALEWESGVCAAEHGPELGFLRSLVLAGRWDDALAFVEPLEGIDGVDTRRIRYVLLKHKLLELLARRPIAGNWTAAPHGARPSEVQSVDGIVACLQAIEKECDSKTEFNELCYLLALKHFTDHDSYAGWSVSGSRIDCFDALLPLVATVLNVPDDDVPLKRTYATAGDPNRLVALFMHGMLYEGGKALHCPRMSSAECYDCIVAHCGRNHASYKWLRRSAAVPETSVLSLKKDAMLRQSYSRLPQDPYSGVDGADTRANSKPDEPHTLPAGGTTAAHANASTAGRTLKGSVVGALDALAADLKVDHVRASTNNWSSKEAPIHVPHGVSLASHTNERVRDAAKTAWASKQDSNPDVSSTPMASKRDVGHVTATPAWPLRNDLEDMPPRAIASSARDISRVHGAAQSSKEESGGAAARVEYARASAPNKAVHQKDGRHAATSAKRQSVPPSASVRESAYRPPPVFGVQDTMAAVFTPTYRAVLSVDDAQPIRAVAFDPSGCLFAVGANSRTLRVCATAHGTSVACGPAAVLVKRNKHHKGSIYCVAWSPDSALIATGSNDKTVRVLGFDTAAQRAQGDPIDLAGHDGTVRDVAFCLGPGGGHAVVSGGAGDCALRIFDPITASCVGVLRGHSNHVHGIRALSPWHSTQLAGASVASVAADGTLRLWDVRMRDCAATIRVVDGTSEATGLTSLSVDPVSVNTVATGKATGGVAIVDLTMRRVMHELTPHADECRSVSHSPDGRWIVTGSYDATVRVTRCEGAPRTCIVGYHADKVTQCAWHPSGASLLSAGADKLVKYWEPDMKTDF